MVALRVLACLALVLACASPAGPAPTNGEPTLTPADTAPSPTAAVSPTPATLTTQPSPTLAASPSAGQTPAPTDQPSPTSTPGGGLPDRLDWMQLEMASAPAAREDHTWTVAPGGEAAYLFGGRAGRTAFDDLWHYDLVADRWTRVETSGTPPARFGHVAVWHAELGLVVWSGQADATTFFADIWAYDPQAKAWQELPSAGDPPIARYGSCGGIGPDGGLWVSHGFTDDAGRFRDTRAYDFASGTWADLTPAGGPVERCLHDCFWSTDGRLILYGGQTTGLPALGDLWTYDRAQAAWEQQPAPPAPARQLYALAVLGGEAYVFGGGDVNRGYLNDLWRLSLADLSWTALAPSGETPAARSGAAFVADPARNRVLLFGGRQQRGEAGDTWVLAASGG